jgi:hypothetical protein
MTPADIDPKIVTQRAAWVLEMIAALRDLPLKTKEDFLRNRNNVAAAESYLRRSLEALFDNHLDEIKLLLDRMLRANPFP